MDNFTWGFRWESKDCVLGRGRDEFLTLIESEECYLLKSLNLPQSKTMYKAEHIFG